MTAVVHTSRFCKTLQGRRVLTELELQLAPGECVAVVGENAAGKTTLLRCLAGELRPSSGSICWFKQSTFTPEIRRKIGFVRHKPHIYPDLTVRENLLFVARMYDVVHPRLRTHEQLQRYKLGGFADDLAGTLSRGVCQRATIACATIHEPQFVILDEPFTGLDGSGRVLLNSLFAEWRSRGNTVCFSSHLAQHLRTLSTRTVHLHCGRLLEDTQRKPTDHTRVGAGERDHWNAA